MGKNMKRLVFFLVASAFFHDLSLAGSPRKSDPRVQATRFEIKLGETSSRGRLYVTIGGKERKIADTVSKAWLINDGREIVYSRRKDGAGGFENDGESLRIHDLATGKVRKVLSEYYTVDDVLETKLSTGE